MQNKKTIVFTGFSIETLERQLNEANARNLTTQKTNNSKAKKKLFLRSLIVGALIVIFGLIIGFVLAPLFSDNSDNSYYDEIKTTKVTQSPIKSTSKATLNTTTPQKGCFGSAISNCNIECGKYFLDTKIVGGVEAKPHSWPSTVYLEIFYKFDMGFQTGTASFLCGGTLIDESTVLTAAHCVQYRMTESGYIGRFDKVIVTFGAHNLNDYSTKYTITSNNVKTHEFWDSEKLLYDIALIKLPTKATLNRYVQIACLPTETINLVSNDQAIAVGWGTTSSGGSTSDVLLQVNLTIYSSDKCSKVSSPSYSRFQICAGYLPGGKDTCQGDSGGPLFVKQTVNGVSKYVVAGLTSFGYQCALPNSPGIYTRTSYFLDWILRNI